IGTPAPVTSTYTPPNHRSALDRPQVILEHIQNELASDRYTGPFTKYTLTNLIGPFRTAPL
ncbi:hypothetical protein BDV93DRAFT_418014, partial [Ceratobasidium sp. AG-I]